MGRTKPIAPTGHLSTIKPAKVPTGKPVTGDKKPNTYRGRGLPHAGAGTPGPKPAHNSAGHAVAGPVGATPTKPNLNQHPSSDPLLSNDKFPTTPGQVVQSKTGGE
jgi:hypothetical protein